MLFCSSPQCAQWELEPIATGFLSIVTEGFGS